VCVCVCVCVSLTLPKLVTIQSKAFCRIVSDVADGIYLNFLAHVLLMSCCGVVMDTADM
jgi:hypothetical protein